MASIGIADKTTLDAVKNAVDDIAVSGSELVEATLSIETKLDTVNTKIDNIGTGGGGGGGGGTVDMSNIQVFVLDLLNDEVNTTAGAVDNVKRRLTT